MRSQQTITALVLATTLAIWTSAAAQDPPVPSDEDLQQAMALLQAATAADPFEPSQLLVGADQPVAFWEVQARRPVLIPVEGPLPEELAIELAQIRDHQGDGSGWRLSPGAPLGGLRDVVFSYSPESGCTHAIEFGFAVGTSGTALRKIVALTECD